LTEINEVNTWRLLDLIFELHGQDKHYPYDNPPYSISKLGAVTLSKALRSELIKDENKDLLVWARKNIVSLFI